MRPDIRSAAQSLAVSGNFDAAIFEAYKLVEDAIQSRIQSRSIGQVLLNEAFDGTPPKILIASDVRDQEGAKSLFSGALGHIRNDRGHKKAPFLPCTSLEACFLYLHNAEFLLYLLDKDRNIFPHIEVVEVTGQPDQPRAVLQGRNFKPGARVLADGHSVQIAQLTEARLEVALPPRFHGRLRVVCDGNESNEVTCTVPSGERPINWRRVLYPDVPLYQDQACTQLIPDVVGVLLQAYDPGHEFEQVMPARLGQYRAGYYVTHGPFRNEGVGEAWYRDPRSGEVCYAWTTSAFMAAPEVGEAGHFMLEGLRILPNSIRTEVGEVRTLRVMGYGHDGPIPLEEDVTDQVKWASSRSHVAVVTDGGILRPKQLGQADISCRHGGRGASARVMVGNQPKGTKAVYFQGLRRMQPPCVDLDDNVYLCNQAEAVYRLARSGGLEQVLLLPNLVGQPFGINHIAMDAQRTLYVTAIGIEGCLRCRWDGTKYGSPEEIATVLRGAKQGVAVDDQGNVFVAVMGEQPGKGAIIHVHPDGQETYFATRDMALYLAFDAQGNICTPSRAGGSIDVYDRSGELRRRIKHGVLGSESGLYIDRAGVIYLPQFYDGKLLKIEPAAGGQVTATGVIETTAKSTTVADGLGVPGGVTMDSRGRLYVPDFDGDRLWVIY